MENQIFDVDDLLGKATQDFLTALKHLMSVIFVGTGWKLFLDNKTKRWMLSKESREDLRMEAGSNCTNLLNDAMISFHMEIQRTANKILNLIGFDHNIFKDDSGRWTLIHSNLETEVERRNRVDDIVTGEKEGRQKPVRRFGDRKMRSGRRGQGSFGRRPSQEISGGFHDRGEPAHENVPNSSNISEEDIENELLNLDSYNMMENSVEDNENEPLGSFDNMEQPEEIGNYLSQTADYRDKPHNLEAGMRDGAHAKPYDIQNTMENSVEDNENELLGSFDKMEQLEEIGNNLSQTTDDRDKPHNLEAGMRDGAHEKQSDIRNTGHSGGVFQARQEELGDGIGNPGMECPHKEPPSGENTKSVSEINDDLKKKRKRKGQKKQTTKSQNEARTGVTDETGGTEETGLTRGTEKQFILKKGLEAQKVIVIIEEMPKWPRLTGGRYEQFNKNISKADKRWIDNTIFKLHYVSPENVLSEKQKSADKKTMDKINERNSEQLGIFLISSLKPGCYLADDIIYTYSKLLSISKFTLQNRSRFFIFTTYFYIQGRNAMKEKNVVDDWPFFYVIGSKVRNSDGDFGRRDHLIFPVCNGKHHMLLIFNVRQWQLLILDPLNFTDFQQEAADFVITAVKNILYMRAPKRLKRKEVTCYAPKCIPRQPSGTGDCGIFVCMYLNAYIRGLDLTGMQWGPEDIMNFRYRLAKDVVLDKFPSNDDTVQVD